MPKSKISSTISSHKIGPKLLELLGVPQDRCNRAMIMIEANEPVMITATYFAEMEINPDTESLKTEIRKFSLVED